MSPQRPWGKWRSIAGHYIVTADAAHGGISEEFVISGMPGLDLNPGSNDFLFV